MYTKGTSENIEVSLLERCPDYRGVLIIDVS